MHDQQPGAGNHRSPLHLLATTLHHVADFLDGGPANLVTGDDITSDNRTNYYHQPDHFGPDDYDDRSGALDAPRLSGGA